LECKIRFKKQAWALSFLIQNNKMYYFYNCELVIMIHIQDSIMSQMVRDILLLEKEARCSPSQKLTRDESTFSKGSFSTDVTGEEYPRRSKTILQCGLTSHTYS
jgi:hypothetical protein